VIDFDLRETVESTVEMLAERAHKQGIELACQIEFEVPEQVRGDPVRIRQVLANLLSNAVKFTERGEVVVRVSMAAEPDGEAKALFEVTDSGVGITPEAMSRIFHEFTQADGSTTRKYGGTGLGLTISKQLVSLMNGEIGVDSTPGKGSRFWFKLPLAKQSGASNVDPADPARDTIAGLRLLLVEANPTQRRILKDLLQHWGVECDEADSSAKALSMIQNCGNAGDAYPLILIDLDLPDVDGLSLAQTVKNDPQLSPSRIVMVTTLLNRPSIATMQATGISACLVKPVRQSRLAECLTDVMSTSGATTAQPLSEAEGSTFANQDLRAVAKGVRILLAEDNLVNQRVALKQLKKLGFSADAVSNGNEVLSALQRIPYDIIIMDCQMPELDGYEVTRRIRQGGSDSYIHLKSAPYIIALTANALQGDRERCLALGMNDYLTKPLHLRDLEAVLQRALLRIQPPLPVALPASPADPKPESLDRSIINGLKELREPGQPDPFRELVELFLKDAHPRLLAMTEAAAAADLPKLALASHTLKGSASNLGARQLAMLCATLEKQAKAGEAADVTESLDAVKAEFEYVRTLLAAELED